MWEYKTITMKVKPKGFINTLPDLTPLENTLNELGRAGWELVSTQLPHQMQNRVSAVLKRKK